MEPLTSRWDHDTAMVLAATEYDRCATLLRRIPAADWARSTECPDWDVRQMVAHMVGMAQMVTSMRENVRQQRLAGRAGGGIDQLTALQVAERADWTPDRLAAEFAEIAPRAVAGRRRIPRFVRARRLPGVQLIDGVAEKWTIGYLGDVILTRDPWMHRIDITQATGLDHEVTAEHDGAIVADVVQEWSDRHGRDFDLTLTGPAGGHWVVGTSGPTITADAIEFCRVLSGRPGTAVLSELAGTSVPF